MWLQLLICTLLFTLGRALFGKKKDEIQRNDLYDSPEVIRANLNELNDAGRTMDVISYLDEIERRHGSLILDGELPSLYNYKGVALYAALRLDEAEAALNQSVHYFPEDTRAWINLGEIQVQTFKLDNAVSSFNEALRAGDYSALPRLMRTKGWSASWHNFELYAADLEAQARVCVTDFTRCKIDSAGGLEYSDAPGRAQVLLQGLNPHSQESQHLIPVDARASLWLQAPAAEGYYTNGHNGDYDDNDSGEWNEDDSALSDSSASIVTTSSSASSSASPFASTLEQILDAAQTRIIHNKNIAFIEDRKVNSKAVQLHKFQQQQQQRRVKIGFISADFGVHPVATLVRGLVQFIDRRRAEVYCFSLQPKISWWGNNVTAVADHFIWLQSMNTYDAAWLIAALGVEIMVDLNGHTMHSGLSIMAHRPAPLQMSYLGLPTSSAAPFIDYYIGDRVALPPELRDHFSEQLVLMNPCYIANDYAQVQGQVLRFRGEKCAPRTAVNTTSTSAEQLANGAELLFATLSNSQKMDPAIFQVWTNLLRRFPSVKMLLMEYAGHEVYMQHLFGYAASMGVEPRRMVAVHQTPWVDHLYTKTAIDLVLDTVVKNGHTTGLDGVWAGVPTVSLAGGDTMPARAAESIAAALDSEAGMAYSLKEYEDLAISIVKSSRKLLFGKRMQPRQPGSGSEPGKLLPRREEHTQQPPPLQSQQGDRSPKLASLNIQDEDHETPQDDHVTAEAPTANLPPPALERAQSVDKLAMWRRHVEIQREVSGLFDTRAFGAEFTRMMQASWELLHIASIHSRYTHGEEWSQGQRQSSTAGSAGSTDSGMGMRNRRGLFHIFATEKPSVVDSSYNFGATGGISGRPQRVERITTSQIFPKDSMLYDAVHAFNRPEVNISDLILRRRAQNYYYSFKTEEMVYWSPCEEAGNCAEEEDVEEADNENGPGQGTRTAHNGDGRDKRDRQKKPKKFSKTYRDKKKKKDKKKQQQQSRDSRPTASDLDRKEFPPIPEYVFDGRLIMLNIGGLFKDPREGTGWLSVNAQQDSYNMEGGAVDIVREMHDLYGLEDNSVTAIYSSHTLEHGPFGDGTMQKTLKEWYRVVRPGGLVLISVPDMDTLAGLYLNQSLALNDRWTVTKMIFGAQFDEFDYHKVGFNFDILRFFLVEAGFCEVERVGAFNMPFRDSSSLHFKGVFISLNVVARVCPPTTTPPPPAAAAGSPGGGVGVRGKVLPAGQEYDGFRIDHHADPYATVQPIPQQ